MPFLSRDERAFARMIVDLAYCNPFLPERVTYERAILGDEMVEGKAVWSKRADLERGRVNVEKIMRRLEPLIERLRDRLIDGERPSGDDLTLYENLAFFVVYHRHYADFRESLARAARGKSRPRFSFYDDFVAEIGRLLDLPGLDLASHSEAPHLFACFFQLFRAFTHIFDSIIGESMPAARLRAAVWQSIFTHDMRRYRRVLTNRMADITTLITGPSGTGKELVAQAIGLSRYIPFDPATQTFTQDFSSSFYALNITALAPTLIESELFGHRRGAFTGAMTDRAGWLEICPPLGTVFLDEMGDIDGSIQVKLLRVLQSRLFQRMGETRDRKFEGKIIAATNRDLADETREGRFREDLYFRLCSDIIVAPSLHEQIRDSSNVLPNLVLFLAQRLVGHDEASALANEVVEWIEERLGADYPWPGNVRELDQCVRNVLVRRAYEPLKAQPRSEAEALVATIDEGTMSADDLLGRYCTIVYARTRNFQETARRLGIDHRTVKSRIDPDLLKRLGG